VGREESESAIDILGEGRADPPAKSYLVLRAVVTCLQCGRRLGFLQRVSDRGRSSASVFFAEGSNSGGPALWRTLRCPTCGGVPILEEYEAVRQRIEHIDWSLDRPRRGRPSKLLVQQRKRDRA
jgi:hypothetical protein